MINRAFLGLLMVCMGSPAIAASPISNPSNPILNLKDPELARAWKLVLDRNGPNVGTSSNLRTANRPYPTGEHHLTFGFNVTFLDGLMSHHPDSKYCPAGTACKWNIKEPLNTIYQDGIRDIRVMYPFSYNVLNNGKPLNGVNGAVVASNNSTTEDMLNGLPDRIAQGLTVVNKFNVLMNLNNFPFNLKQRSIHPSDQSCNKTLADGCFSELPSDVNPVVYKASKSCCVYPSWDWFNNNCCKKSAQPTDPNQKWADQCIQKIDTAFSEHPEQPLWPPLYEMNNPVVSDVYEKVIAQVALEISDGNRDAVIGSKCDNSPLCRYVRDYKVPSAYNRRYPDCKTRFTYRCYAKYLYDLSTEYQTAIGPHWDQFTNSFFPDYFKDISCPGGVKKNYFSLDTNNDLFTKLAAKLNSPRYSWELGNEVDCPVYFWGSPSDFTQFANKAYDALKAAVPASKIYIGGYTSDVIPQTENALFSKKFASELKNITALQAPRDGKISFHVYPNPLDASIDNGIVPLATDYASQYENINAKIVNGMIENTTKLNGEAIITEYNIHSTACGFNSAIPCNDKNPMWNYTNGPLFVYEFARLLKFTADHDIKKLYLFTLYDNPDNLSMGPNLGFFGVDGKPRKSYTYFKKVFDVVKNGYTVKHLCNYGDEYNEEWGCSHGDAHYLEFTSAHSKFGDAKRILRVALSDGVTLLPEATETCKVYHYYKSYDNDPRNGSQYYPAQQNVDPTNEFRCNTDPYAYTTFTGPIGSQQKTLRRGSWQIYTGKAISLPAVKSEFIKKTKSATKPSDVIIPGKDIK